MKITIETSEYSFEVLEQIAYETTDPKVLAELAKSDCANIRFWVAGNENASNETVSLLAKDEDVCVRSKAAAHPNASADILLELSCDKDDSVKQLALLNSNTPKG